MRLFTQTHSRAANQRNEERKNSPTNKRASKNKENTQLFCNKWWKKISTNSTPFKHTPKLTSRCVFSVCMIHWICVGPQSKKTPHTYNFSSESSVFIFGLFCLISFEMKKSIWLKAAKKNRVKLKGNSETAATHDRKVQKTENGELLIPRTVCTPLLH